MPFREGTALQMVLITNFKTMNDRLIEMVVEQIREDLANGDVEALEEMLALCPPEVLIGYLPE
jgi:hypothetical protein